MKIGKDVLIRLVVFIMDHNHSMNPEEPHGYSEQPVVINPIRIGDGIWIDQRVCILPGVSIGNLSIIGAGSVVTYNTPDYCMAVCTSARVVKKWKAQIKE